MDAPLYEHCPFEGCPVCGTCPMVITYAGGDREGECMVCATRANEEIE